MQALPVLTLSFCLVACGDTQAATPNVAGTSHANLDPTDITEATLPALGPQDVAFLEQLATNGISESAIAGLGQRRATHPTLRTLSQTWAQEQRQLQDAIMEVAKERRVTLPTEQDTNGAAEYAALTSLAGEQFDTQYIAAQQLLLQSALTLIQNAAAAAVDPTLRTWAAAWLPIAQNRVAQLQSATGT